MIETTPELLSYQTRQAEIELQNAPFAGRKVIFNPDNGQFWWWSEVGWTWRSREDLERLRDHLEADPCAWEADKRLAKLVSGVLEEAT